MDGFIFKKDNYDLDGLLGKAERAGADFIFMIYEEQTETYYIDRMEGRKYDSQFNRFIKRVEDFLAADEEHGLFILVAAIQEGVINLYDGSYEQLETDALGDINLEEDCFFGILLQQQNEQLEAYQCVFMNTNYEGDGRAVIIGNAGVLSDRVEALLDLFV